MGDVLIASEHNLKPWLALGLSTAKYDILAAPFTIQPLSSLDPMCDRYIVSNFIQSPPILAGYEAQ